jgi:hypothetical protein
MVNHTTLCDCMVFVQQKNAVQQQKDSRAWFPHASIRPSGVKAKAHVHGDEGDEWSRLHEQWLPSFPSVLVVYHGWRHPINRGISRFRHIRPVMLCAVASDLSYPSMFTRRDLITQHYLLIVITGTTAYTKRGMVYPEAHFR